MFYQTAFDLTEEPEGTEEGGDIFSDAAFFISEVLFPLPQRRTRLYVLALGEGLRVKGFMLADVGESDYGGAEMEPVRDFLEMAGAEQILLTHNAPRSSGRPTEEDIYMTALFKKHAAAAGITLTDHIIIGEDGIYSLADMGLI